MKSFTCSFDKTKVPLGKFKMFENKYTCGNAEEYIGRFTLYDTDFIVTARFSQPGQGQQIVTNVTLRFEYNFTSY
jgi:hypothetical protein